MAEMDEVIRRISPRNLRSKTDGTLPARISKNNVGGASEGKAIMKNEEDHILVHYGTHLIADYGAPKHALDHLILDTQLNSFESKQRQKRQNEEATKKAEEEGLPFREYEHLKTPPRWIDRKIGEVLQEPRFNRKGEIIRRSANRNTMWRKGDPEFPQGAEKAEN
jgi:hypothetical protein